MKEYAYENGYPKKVKLSEEQVNEDFEYFFTTIEQNYPYLEVNKELIGVDFVANKEKYRDSLKDVTNAEQLYVGLSRIMQDLNNGHAHLMENSNIKSRNSFHKSTSQNPRIEEAWFEALSDEESFKFYEAIREKNH